MEKLWQLKIPLEVTEQQTTETSFSSTMSFLPQNVMSFLRDKGHNVTMCKTQLTSSVKIIAVNHTSSASCGLDRPRRSPRTLTSSNSISPVNSRSPEENFLHLGILQLTHTNLPSFWFTRFRMAFEHRTMEEKKTLTVQLTWTTKHLSGTNKLIILSMI